MQLGFMTVNDPTEELGSETLVNVEHIEAIRVERDYTVLQMRSGRIHYTSLSKEEVWAKITEVAEHFE